MSESAPAVQNVNVQDLAQAIRAAVEETAPLKQVHISRYRAKTPWNPTGDKNRPKLKQKVFQNGRLVRPEFITNADIELLNQLRPGRYISRKVEVIGREDGTNERSIEIRYRNATVEQRMELKNYFRNFTELLQLIVREQGPAKAAKG